MARFPFRKKRREACIAAVIRSGNSHVVVDQTAVAQAWARALAAALQRQEQEQEQEQELEED
ncbi:MAG: hypothetical protein QJR06_06515 [Alicyclobacillaceae bacterium]|nr:hypothetical protein [Alicyclobacillaceae bacterium]